MVVVTEANEEAANKEIHILLRKVITSGALPERKVCLSSKKV